MGSVAHEARLPVIRPPLPTWKAAFTAAFLGWAITFFAVFAVALLASLLGLLERPVGGGLRDWPYPEAGVSSVLANSVIWFWLILVAALVMRGLLADRYGGRCSAVPIFFAVALTGFAPGLPRGILDLPWPVAFLATAALLRLTPAFAPRPLPKRVTARVLVAAALLLAISAFHAYQHPLWPGYAVVVESDPPAPKGVTFSLENAGFSAVELEAVSLRAPFPTRVEDVRVDSTPPAPDWFGESPRLPYTVPARRDAFVELRLDRMPCGTGHVQGEAVVRYRVRGKTRVETLPVELALRTCA